MPYTVIREITENFIHAGFLECTVSILDGGNTLRFADQGPGITKKDLVLQPGISSATRTMKEYIRGVGSGFPIVREYLTTSKGHMSIEDNAEEGVVVTISLVDKALFNSFSSEDLREKKPHQDSSQDTLPPQTEASSPLKQNVLKDKPSNIILTTREEQALQVLHKQGMLGPVDLAGFLDVSAPTAYRLLQKLEQLGMVESTQLKKRILSNAGMAYIQELLT